jgi:L-seryl-tRNA(Ser) seleniumtransferase
LLRDLPSVDEVLQKLTHLSELPPKLLANEVRAVIAERRTAILSGAAISDESIEQIVEARLAALLQPSLRPVINASGVILHTNLGRAPLSGFQPITRYSNLEYDLVTGKRGKRDAHTQPLLQRLLGRPAVLVNNNAAAVFLILNELAAGYEVIVSRGELVEIGDGFRIPEIMARSGAILREVGTTNRTRIDDYREAITGKTRAILRVHPSNFHIAGFTGRPRLLELAELGRQHNISVYEDLGSGCLADLRPYGISEPLVTDSFRAGVNLVSFSCDKLLGGPQSGIIAGDAELVERIRRNALYRAFRVDKLVIESLQKTLQHLLLERWDAIPTLQMIFADVEEVYRRAQRVQEKLAMPNVQLRQGESAIGGGSTPDQSLPTWVVEITVRSAAKFERALRKHRAPVICRIERDKILLDMRTVSDGEEELLVAAVSEAARS